VIKIKGVFVGKWSVLFFRSFLLLLLLLLLLLFSVCGFWCCDELMYLAVRSVG